MNVIQQIAGGDIQSLSDLYEAYKTKVYRLAFSLSGDPFLAEDVTQETFLRIQCQAASYRRSDSEGAWIMTIARHMTYDILRKRNREVIDSDSIAVQELQAPSTEETSNYYFLELLQGLSTQEKEVVSLRLLTGLSWKELAQVTGDTAEACRKRYTRALQKIKATL